MQSNRIAMMSFIRLAFLFSIIHETVQIKQYSLRSIRNLVVQLRNDSDSMAEYVAKIQGLFCPEQQFCGALLSDSRQKVINSLPAMVTVENRTVITDELSSFIGTCCLPCSCEDTCKYDNNCCLTKAFENNTFNDKLTSSRSSECIASASKSYKSKHGLTGPADSQYFMTTQFFSDTNASIKAKCETPNPYDVTDTIPVTSLSSGHTYWNQHCALCNNDSEAIVFWNIAVVFRAQFIFYKSASGIYVFPDTKEEFYNQLLAYEELYYIPPFEMKQKRCTPRHAQNSCRKSRKDTFEADHQFLYETCNMFTTPIIVGLMNFVAYKNIFCYICNEEIAIAAEYECSFSDDLKHSKGAMIGLLNYNDETESSTYIKSHGNGNCSCMEIYDTYREKCRPLYCPPGSLFSAGCRCTEIMASVSGMPVLLKLKVTAELGSVYPVTDVLAPQFRKALQRAMQKSIEHVSIEIHYSFRPRNETNSYYLYVAIIRSDDGYDTKETLKPLLAFLYADVFLKVTSNGNKYSVGLVSKILFKSINGRFVSAVDPKNQIEFDVEFSVVKNSFTTYELYQELSPLLFCKQVQLNESEFTERQGQIIINTTSTVLSVSDFYLTATMKARLCLDHYLSRPLVSFGNIKAPVMILLIVLCFCIHLALRKSMD